MVDTARGQEFNYGCATLPAFGVTAERPHGRSVAPSPEGEQREFSRKLGKDADVGRHAWHQSDEGDLMATEDSGVDGVDPVTAAGLSKLGAEGGVEALRLFSRVLGPSADEIGEALRRKTAYRVGNVTRIVEKADAKSSGEGKVPPRIAYRVLEEGSYCDDELMAEYLSGVLAGSRTRYGRDDRGIVWSTLVTGLSSIQIRAHFLLYREWAARLQEITDPDLNVGVDGGRRKVRMQIDLSEFLLALQPDAEVADLSGLTHAITGLHRVGLIDSHYQWGPTADLVGVASSFPEVLIIQPSTAGMELYGWAAGTAGMTPKEFLLEARSFAEDEVPRLSGVEIWGYMSPPPPISPPFPPS